MCAPKSIADAVAANKGIMSSIILIFLGINCFPPKRPRMCNFDATTYGRAHHKLILQIKIGSNFEILQVEHGRRKKMNRTSKSVFALISAAVLSLMLFACGSGGYGKGKSPQPMPGPYASSTGH